MRSSENQVASSRQSLRHNTDSAYNFVAYDLVKSALSESQAEVEEKNSHNVRFRAL